jgi:phage terminase small subunit
MALNPRHEKFCRLYHESGNGSESYRTAYECSKNVARQNAWRLLTNAGIKARLEQLAGEQAERCDLSSDDVVDILVKAILTPIEDVDEGSILCEEATPGEHGTKIKMISKVAAIKELNRMLGHYEPEKHEHDVSDDLAAVIRLATGAREE